jgi:glycosyltransferase involved in cell wall biosynthesis
MSFETQPISFDAQIPAEALKGRRRIRVAMVCDYLEEQWPSMDLVGDMLSLHLATGCCDEVLAQQLRPQMRRRISCLRFLPQQPASNADRLINRFIDYSSFLRGIQNAYDLFHIVDHSYAQLIYSLPPSRTIVTCHDLDTFRCVLEPEREKRPAWFRAMSRRILGGFRKAEHVIAVSAATREELLHHNLFRPEQISVIRNGVHPSCSAQSNEAAEDNAGKLLGPALGRPLLLNVGNTLPRKRLDVLLRVFAAVVREIPEARLVRVGGFTQDQIELVRQLNLERAVVNLPFLNRQNLAAIYRCATLLVHTAEAEGFGLPVIEAMACGCPVVASDLPVLREVGGVVASYCPVADVPAWTHTLVQLLEERLRHPRAWAGRLQEGLAWAARFSWAENARQTARIYRKVMEKAA